MNYYERHIGDYLKDTAHLSLLEHGIYCRLLDVYYTRERPLDQNGIARLIGCRTDEEVDVAIAVLSEFFVEGEGGTYTQPRCEREIARFKDKQAQAKRAAAASVASRQASAERPLNAGSAPAERTLNVPSLQTPDTSNQIKELETQRASRLPAAWPIPPDLFAYCREQRPDLDPERVAQDFRDYWHSKPGRDGRKLDWPATFRMWVRNQRAPLKLAGSEDRFKGAI